MILKTSKDVKRVLTATMNTLNFATGICGLLLSLKGFALYGVLPAGNQNDLMTLEAVALTVFGGIVSLITLGGGFWLNRGSNQFKVKMCGVMGFVAVALVSLRAAFPQYENTANTRVLNSVKSYYKEDPSKTSHQQLVDHLHVTYRCCGYLGPDDFSRNENLPRSCCTTFRLVEGKCTRRVARKIGCMMRINAMIENGAAWLKSLCFVTPCVINGLIMTLVVMVVMYNDHTAPADKIKWYY